MSERQPLSSNPAPIYGQPQVVMLPPSTLYGKEPVLVLCPHCRVQSFTEIKREYGVCTWLSCCGCCCLGCWFGCCLIPFCVPQLHDVEHRCGNCKSFLGKHTPL
mmetsp:Transcript_20162/g.37521  ORF Transcript_20162/g.37521 Transcript_20162/m.37521 type:complete len:104 (-) Transcript_20162:8731-9042(-)